MNIKIGGLIYEIHFVLNEEFNSFLISAGKPLEEIENVLSFINYQGTEIYIRKELSKSYQKELALHEILHGLLDNGAYENLFNGKELSAESFITILTPRLHEFLINNKEFFDWIYS